MRIEHLALSHLTCRIGGCLVPLELEDMSHKRKRPNGHQPARSLTQNFGYFVALQNMKKCKNSLGRLDNTIGGRVTKAGQAAGMICPRRSTRLTSEAAWPSRGRGTAN